MWKEGKREMGDRRAVIYRLLAAAAGVLMLLAAGIYFGKKWCGEWRYGQACLGGQAVLSGVESKLEDEDNCFLCGSSKRSLAGYYRRCGMTGMVFVNNWYILALEPDGGWDEGKDTCESRSGHIGEMSYQTWFYPDREMVSVEVGWDKESMLDIDFVQKNLCQKCLDQVLDSMDTAGRDGSKSEPLPLCLVDFRTGQVYAVQQGYTGYQIRDSWIEFEYGENEVEAEAFRQHIR